MPGGAQTAQDEESHIGQEPSHGKGTTPTQGSRIQQAKITQFTQPLVGHAGTDTGKSGKVSGGSQRQLCQEIKKPATSAGNLYRNLWSLYRNLEIISHRLILRRDPTQLGKFPRDILPRSRMFKSNLGADSQQGLSQGLLVNLLLLLLQPAPGSRFSSSLRLP